MSEMTHARYWHPVADDRLECVLCPRHCRLRDGQSGLCFVRQRRGNGIVLAAYGLTSGACADPIEKKPLYHFHPGSRVLSFGTVGCNLTCSFCQNADISKARDARRLSLAARSEDIAQAAKDHRCAGVAYTYNEPLVSFEYTVDTAAACRAAGLFNVAVTAGYVEAEPRREFFAAMDAANVDLKGFSERFYRTLCSANLKPVLDTLEYLARETSVWLEVTTLLIPGENDSEGEIDAMTAWMADRLGPDVPLHFSAFHPAWRLTNKPSTSPDVLARAHAIAKNNGLHHVYVGNVRDPQRSATWCAACGTLLVERDGFATSLRRLTKNGECDQCGALLAGVFDTPGA